MKRWRPALPLILILGFLLLLGGRMGAGDPRWLSLGGPYRLAARAPVPVFAAYLDQAARQAIAAGRTEMMERGMEPPGDAARNLARDPFAPETGIRVLDRNGLAAAPSRQQVVSYKATFGEPAERHLLLQVAQVDGENVLIPEPASATPDLVRSPARNQYMFQQDSSIFLIDGDSLAVRELTPAVAGGRNIRRQLIEEAVLAAAPDAGGHRPILYWAENAMWSPDGRYIAFNSNRDNLEALGIWVVDVESGAVTRLLGHGDRAETVSAAGEPPYHFILRGWVDERTLLFEAYQPTRGMLWLGTVSLEGEMAKLPIRGLVMGVGSHLVAVAHETPAATIRLYDVRSGNLTRVDAPEGWYYMPTVVLDPTGTMGATLIASPETGERRLFIFDRDGKILAEEKAPQKGDFRSDLQWVDPSALVVAVGRPDGTDAAWLFTLAHR